MDPLFYALVMLCETQVTTQEAKAAAANLGVRLVEVSAKSNVGIEDAYVHLVELVMKRKGIQPGGKGAAGNE